MKLKHLLEEKHFNRLTNDKVFNLANTDADFCAQWLIHSIRSNAKTFELILAIGFADKWKLEILSTLEKYLINIPTSNDINDEDINDKILKVESLSGNVSIARITHIFSKLNVYGSQQSNIIQHNETIKTSKSALLENCHQKITSDAKPHLKDVTLFGKQDQGSTNKSIRNNRHFPTPLPNNSIELALLERCMSEHANTSIEFAEPPVILQYTAGQYYKWHYDHIYPHNQTIQKQIEQFGQRVKTAIYYLNDDFIGGATEFKHPYIQVKPQSGNILTFDNTDESGQRLKESLHKGSEVTEGTKWIITLWFRNKPFWLRAGLLE